jgi:hypothetical protein
MLRHPNSDFKKNTDLAFCHQMPVGIFLVSEVPAAAAHGQAQDGFI